MKLKDTGLTAQDIKDKVNMNMLETYERFDFLAETAEGMYLYDENGTPYLDFYAGIAVNNAGSRNPKVVAAVKDQVDDIMHTFNYPYTIPQALLAEKVCETIGMDKIFFQNSGTEANEAMIKMARKYGIEKYGPNKYHIVTAKMGFHGRTFGAMSATGQPGNGCQVGFGPMTYGFSYAPYNDLKAFKDACTENTIAIMIEPVQGEGGVHPATQEFMTGLREFCDENGMLLLIDEVQTGWCRTGAVMSYMNYGIKPDIVSMAKGLGGGMPIGAICATAEVARAFTPGSHGTTFGGHPVSCAAAYAEVGELLDRDLAGNAKKMGDYFSEKLAKMPHVKEVRHQGLLVGVELDDAVSGVEVKHACLDRKLLITAIGVSYFLQNSALLIWKAAARSYPPVVTGAVKIFGGKLTVSYVSLLTITACVVIMIGLTTFVNKSKMGKAMRACSEDKAAAQLMGINVNATISATFAIGSALAAIAGVLLCSFNTSLMPTTGSMPGIKAFTAAVFGGIGSIPGAFLGGLLLGIIEAMAQAYISTNLANSIVFAVLIVVLLVKPAGLLGKSVTEKV